MSADTQDAETAIRESAAEREQEQREAVVELEGVARDLFVKRYEDTFSIDIHGTDIEFYRPVDASELDLSELDEDTAARIERGSDLLDQFEQRQEQLLRAANDGDMSISELVDESMDGVELQAKVLAAHAVDESLTDARVWKAMFRNDEKLSDVFNDFFGEGSSEQTQQKLDALDGMLSGNSSTN